ncbi:unnamed protein product [Clonostachys rhizophaga]|uniref:Alginate lyase domain-containing protein n=1 Tax=Clonostachys rhizophaga TaxID=160324 RepID=A0A9N9VL52_9HYPO|nr:unnamed protein product [Clonostachys rhizophaga]
MYGRTLLVPFLVTLFSLVSHVFSFTHPGLLVTSEDVSRAKKHIDAKQDPWYGSWEKLAASKYSSSTYQANPSKTIDRPSNGELMWRDAAAAFNLALQWKISGDTAFADASVKILLAWAETFQGFDGGDDRYLSAGLQGYQFANTAELLRDYEPFAKADLSTVGAFLTSQFLAVNEFFLDHKAPSEHNHKHFYANWELSNLASMMAIAVVTENTTAWDYAINYFKNGSGNGAINNAIVYIVDEPGTGRPLGQGQESGRDQGHSALNQQVLAVIGQQAWNQGEDLFSYNDSRILKGAEYFARYNLGNDVPFVEYTNGIVTHTEVSSASRGATRPTWELLYHHYVGVKKLDAPWTKAYLNKTLEEYGGFEPGSGAMGEGSGRFDGLGWGSLLYRVDDSDVVESSSASETPARTTTSSSSATPTGSSTLIDKVTSATPVSSTLSSTVDTIPIATPTSTTSRHTPTARPCSRKRKRSHRI